MERLRACGTTIDRPMNVKTNNDDVQSSQKALDRILKTYALLYCM